MKTFNRFHIVIVVIMSFWTSCAPADQRVAGHYVRLAEAATFRLKAGGERLLQLQFSVDTGFHIIGDTGAADNFLATRLDLFGTSDIQFKEPAFPTLKPLVINGLEEAVPVLEGTVKVEVPVFIDSSARPGVHQLQGQLYYQACDAVKCFFPKELVFPITLYIL